MGLDLRNVCSSDYGELRCAVCNGLASLNSYVTSNCNHVICKECCSSRDLKICPTCRGNAGDIGCLELNQPLAHRILGKLKVVCPLRGSVRDHSQNGCDCQWVGEYHQLKFHLETVHRGAHITPTLPAQTQKGKRLKNLFGRSAGEKKSDNPDSLGKSSSSISYVPAVAMPRPQSFGNLPSLASQSSQMPSHLDKGTERTGGTALIPTAMPPSQKPAWLDKQLDRQDYKGNRDPDQSTYSHKVPRNGKQPKRIPIANPSDRPEVRKLPPHDQRRTQQRLYELQDKAFIDQSAKDAYVQGIHRETEVRKRDHIHTARSSSMGMITSCSPSSPFQYPGSNLMQERVRQKRRAATRRNSVDNGSLPQTLIPLDPEDCKASIVGGKPGLERENSPTGLVPDPLLPDISEFSRIRRSISAPPKADLSTASKASAGLETFHTVNRHGKERAMEENKKRRDKGSRTRNRSRPRGNRRKSSPRRTKTEEGKHSDELRGSNHSKHHVKQHTRKVKRRPSH